MQKKYIKPFVVVNDFIIKSGYMIGGNPDMSTHDQYGKESFYENSDEDFVEGYYHSNPWED